MFDIWFFSVVINIFNGFVKREAVFFPILNTYFLLRNCYQQFKVIIELKTRCSVAIMLGSTCELITQLKWNQKMKWSIFFNNYYLIFLKKWNCWCFKWYCLLQITDISQLPLADPSFHKREHYQKKDE